MENTIENAAKYLEYKYGYTRERSEENDKWLHEMVAYTAACSAPSSIGEDELRNKLSLLKEDGYSLDYQDGFIGCFEWLRSSLPNRKIVLPSEIEKKQLHTISNWYDGERCGWNDCLSEIKRLNPNLK